MKFSLIMATLDRAEEIALFLNKLSAQTYKNFELIIVDQNDDGRVYNLYLKYKDIIELKYIHSNKKGLSLSRNIGLNNCNGDIIAFPDDDCEYSADTLENVFKFFNNNPDYAFYTCNTKDKNNGNTILNSKKKDTDISIFNIMFTGISFTIFVRAVSIKKFRFDTQMGVGAEYGSGEESDLLLYLLRNVNKGRYNANSYIHHPYKIDNTDRAFSYGKGFGALYKKAISTYRYYILFPVFMYLLFKQFLMICLHPFEKGRIASLKGRLYGFIHYKLSRE
ncbi:MAG: glycosyltransferase family 2 protein [Bacteroidales bacterium]|nr:glycosyltransferase family 2 protein [Bacteroidales bacterium]